MTKKVHVVINPASGQPQPILNQINDVFYPAGVQWSVSITLQSGDATRFAEQAIAEGVDVVCSYGGDGTVMEVAKAVQGGDIPMAILPGGTANLMSVELGVPKDLTKAAEIVVDPNSVVRQVDMGQVGDGAFMLRVGIGYEGEKVKMADREMKDKWGILAYSIAGMKAMQTAPLANYRLTVDGEQFEATGIACDIYNAGNIGMKGVSASKGINVSDGLMDVFVVRNASLSSLSAIGDSFLGKEPDQNAVKHWRFQEIQIECDPPQIVQVDGEVWDPQPAINVRVLPGMLPILTPPEEQKAQ
jgi:YegS/Rv2252/BmrU family lipid kinase